MWRLCGKLWTWTLKWTLKREELLSSRIEFNRQRIVLYSSLSLPLSFSRFFCYPRFYPPNDARLLFYYLYYFSPPFPQSMPSSPHFIYTLSNYSSCARCFFFLPCFFFWIKKMSIQEINIYFSTNKWNKCIWPFSLKSHNPCRWIFNATIEKYFFFFQITIYRAIFHRENFLSNFHDQSSLPVPPRSRLKIELYFWYRAI